MPFGTNTYLTLISNLSAPNREDKFKHQLRRKLLVIEESRASLCQVQMMRLRLPSIELDIDLRY